MDKKENETRAMQPLSEQHRQELERLCREFHVQRIELFGSAVSGAFDAQNSDLDFLVTFDELGRGQYADSYFGLLESLQELFHRPIDLVVASSIKNPYFLAGIQSTRTLLYAA